MTPKFSELDYVRTLQEGVSSFEGYVIASLFRNGRWLYKISLTESGNAIFDNWLPEELLEKISPSGR